MRVVSFNLMAPAGPFFPWRDRPARARQLLRALNPDVVCLQEATAYALARLDFRHVGRGRRPDGSGIQCAILYQDGLELLDSGHFWMSDRPSVPGSRFLGMGSCRVATWAVFRDFTVMNVHFSHLRRRRQARLVLEQLKALPRPWVVTGDFNATPWPPWSSHHLLVGHGPLRDAGKSPHLAGLGAPRLDSGLGRVALHQHLRGHRQWVGPFSGRRRFRV